MECHRQKNYKSQDALCLEGTLKTLLYSGEMQIYKNVANKGDAELSEPSGVDTTVQQRVWAQCGGFTSGTTTLDPLRAGTWNKWRCVRWAVTVRKHAAVWRSGFCLVIRAISLCTGEPRAREPMLLALCGSMLVGCGQRRRSGGENAAGVHAGHKLCRGAPTYSPPGNTHLRILSWATLHPYLILCRCCGSSWPTTWQTTTSGCHCSAAPIPTHSHTLKDFVWACCCCWDMLLSTLPSYHRWRIK